MGELAIRKKGSSISVPAITYDSLSGLFTSTTSGFTVYKASWTQICVLNSTEWKLAIAYGKMKFNTFYYVFQLGELDTEFNFGTFSTYGQIFIAKISENESGELVLYLKLADGAPWASLYFDNTNYKFMELALLPIE